MSYTMNNEGQWCVIALPNPKWAMKVFPDKNEEDAVKALWDAILLSVRVREDNDPVEEWERHDAELMKHCDILNEHQFKAVHFKNEKGTDLTVNLVKDHIWVGGGCTTPEGVFFNPNMPTEECFCMPDRNNVNGKVFASKPLSYSGRVIENFWFEFKDGIEFVSRAEGALSGMAASVTLETGETSEESATILFDKGDIIYTNDDKTEGYIRALVMSWGTPGFPHPNYPTRTDAKHALTLDVRQRNNKVKTFEFDVTDQLLLQPHGGVIIVSGLEITKEEGQEGSGGFVPEVDEWGETEDIELPL
jgi:hypothetical protein